LPKLSNPHDRFFKKVFSQRQTAVDFLANYLPEDVLRSLDLEAMEVRKDSFVDEELKESFSDLLYEVKLAGSRAYIYVLFEHKSFPDRYTALQLLKYMVRIWELHLEQSRKRELPVILPLVIYQGVGAWDAGDRLRDLLGSEQKEFFLYAPDFQFLLYDLSRWSDDEIKGGVVARVMLLTMKYALRDELPEKLAGILGLLRDMAEREKGLQYLEVLFRYLVQGTDKLSRQDFEQALTSMPQGERIMATLAEEWLQEGRFEGKLEGKLEEACQFVLELFEEQFGKPSQSLIDKLHQIRSSEVLRLLRRQLKNCRSAIDFERLIEKAL
jgi:predicted transposase/invertase (TIGR01784 family)